MSELVVQVREVSFSYNNHPVLKDVSFDIERGDFLAVIGPNGGGKTTLIKLVLGLLRPDQGVIRVLGEAPGRASHHLGYVPQSSHTNPGFPISVLDVALMGRLGISSRRWGHTSKDLEAVQEALRQVGMWDHRNRRIDELSGGERQRVFIARALSSKPEILFLDEPTTGVDAKGQSDIFRFLHELNRNATIVVVSHDVNVLSSYVKSVACVNQTVFFHHESEITPEMMRTIYHCPVELIAHGIPHRVLGSHKDHGS
jgi:zinc transport system ATP-binding protein